MIDYAAEFEAATSPMERSAAAMGYLQTLVRLEKEQAKAKLNAQAEVDMMPMPEEYALIFKGWPITGVFYDPERMLLRVAWKSSGNYLYFQVPQLVFELFEAVENPIKHFNEHLRGKYGERKLQPGEAALLLDPLADQRPWRREA